jgi:NAD(P)-dependent dehydrogenase (short-subunit alcohol dehydrogenase family)
VLGEIIPSPPTDFALYLAQRQLGLQTVYFGHVMMTNVILPLMPQEGYSRIIFTVSIASYLTGATVASESGEDAYTSAKAALRGYANNLDTVLRAAQKSIRVSTVNPYFMNTDLAKHPTLFTRSRSITSAFLILTKRSTRDLLVCVGCWPMDFRRAWWARLTHNF